MVDKQLVRGAAVFGSTLALMAACSTRTVPLDKGTGKQGSTGGRSATNADAEAGTDSGTTTTGGSGATADGARTPNRAGAKASDELDLLLMVDNSISMADKQAVLARTIPDLVQRVAGSKFTDLHVGVITSSLGGHGATQCQGNDSGSLEEQEVNDHAHLIGSLPRFDLSKYPGALAPTSEGFLEWTSDMPTSGLVSGIQAMVDTADEHGCGLESQLEAVVRFLVDPAPYASVVIQNCPGGTDPCAFPSGVDEALLAQRQAFLRPDSVVAIVDLTDENDCSIREGGQFYYAAREEIVIPPASSACATNPNDPCCYLCAAPGGAPAGCSPDPACAGQLELRPENDPPNLRCFNEKQRFGMDFLYPVERYVNALSSTYICTSRADLAPIESQCPDADADKKADISANPLFVNGDTVRDPSMVYFLGIVGVPYQDLRKDGSGSLVYQTPSELAENGVWDKVLGNPNPENNAPPIPPTDTLMVESIDARTGLDGETPPVGLAPPSADPLANPVNGHERSISGRDDLQYSCIFRLPGANDCEAALKESPPAGCDCVPGSETGKNPVCQNASGGYDTMQRFGRAMPGLRELQVAKGLGANGLAASICAQNLTDDTQDDFGYRPAVDLLLNQIGKSTK